MIITKSLRPKKGDQGKVLKNNSVLADVKRPAQRIMSSMLGDRDNALLLVFYGLLSLVFEI